MPSAGRQTPPWRSHSACAGDDDGAATIAQAATSTPMAALTTTALTTGVPAIYFSYLNDTFTRAR
jgi:hypothetical protein